MTDLSPDTLFRVANAIAAGGWLLLVIAVWRRSATLRDRIAGLDLEARVVAPAIRIADLGREGGQLLTGGNPGLGVHPRQVGRREAHALTQLARGRLALILLTGLTMVARAAAPPDSTPWVI